MQELSVTIKLLDDGRWDVVAEGCGSFAMFSNKPSDVLDNIEGAMIEMVAPGTRWADVQARLSELKKGRGGK